MSPSSTTSRQQRTLQLVSTGRKVTAPETSAKLLARPSLLAKLRDSDSDVVSVMAPAGYGKTTLLAQWARLDPRAFAWLTIDDGDNDPTELLKNLADALDLPADSPGRSPRADIDRARAASPRIRSILDSPSRPFALVLDDVHLLRGPGSVEVVAALIENLPRGSKLVLAGRGNAAVPLGRAVASGRVLQIGQVDLAMTSIECGAVLKAAGLEHAAEVGATVAARVEGWPVGVILAALALHDEPHDLAAAERFAGEHRFVTTYFEEEVLRTLPVSQIEFLLRSSVLDAMCGPLCDAVLQRSDSSRVLDALAQSDTFLVPLDRRGAWYRHHRLLGEALRSILHRQDPGVVRGLHQRARAWFAEQGDLDAAIRHARLAGDDAEGAALAWSGSLAHVSTGRSEVVASWLERFTSEEIAAQPALALTAAWWSVATGHSDELEHWLLEAEHADTDAALPDGTPIRSATVLLRALLGRDSVAQVRADAALAFELDRPDSPYRCVARCLEGSALRLLGEGKLARRRLEDGLALSAIAAPAVQAHCFSQLALLAIDDDDWAGGDELSRSAMGVVDSHGLNDQPAMALPFAVVALSAARRADPTEARGALEHSVALLTSLRGTPPWLRVEAQLLLVRAALLVDDRGMAQTLLGEAKRHVSKCPDIDMLRDELENATRMIENSPIVDGVGDTSLTPAELRVLQYLPTQLTFGELGEQLFVSRNTVKTQVHSVYRKLGVSSRTSAVERARDVGLLGR